MSIDWEPTIWCDEPGCAMWIRCRGATSIRAARLYAKRNGWQRLKRKDICPYGNIIDAGD